MRQVLGTSTVHVAFEILRKDASYIARIKAHALILHVSKVSKTTFSAPYTIIIL
jgi:hypothetical protein